MSFNQSNYDLYQSVLDKWHPWEGKFAWYPIIIDRRIVWFKPYFERCKMFMPQYTKERVLSIFDVLKHD